MRPRFFQLTATAALALGLSFSPAPAFAQDLEQAAFEEGVAAFDVGKYDDAIAAWEPLAEDGNVDALRNLAQMHRLGLGVEQDDARAYELYRRAANLGSDEAQVNIAFQLLTGKGVAEDRTKAAAWFARAADAGNPLAQYNLGLMYEKGFGVEQNKDFAMELYRVAASQGHKTAIARLDALENTAMAENDDPAEGEADAVTAGAGEDARSVQEAQTVAGSGSADMPSYKSEAEQVEDKENNRFSLDVVRTPTRKPGQEMADAPKGDEPTRIVIPEPEEEPTTTAKRQNGFSFSGGAGNDAGSDEAAETASAKEDGIKKDYSGTREAIADAMADVSGTDEDKDYSGTRNAIADAMAARSEDTAAESSEGTASAAGKSGAMALSRIPSDPVARVKLAEEAYRSGDFKSAATMLDPLANAGMPIAQFWMGRMYNRGEGVARDRTMAYSLWRSAASAGSQQAATALANLASRLSPEEISFAEQAHKRSGRAR